MTALLVMLGMLIASLLLIAVTVWVFGKIMAIKAATFSRVLLVALFFFLLNLIVSAPLLVIPSSLHALYSLVSLVVQLLIAAYFIKRYLRTTTGRAWGAVGCVAALQLALLAVVLLFVRPYLVEAFYVPTMAMAPTIRGAHYTIQCPECDGQLLVGVPDTRFHFLPPTEPGICVPGGQTAEVPTASLTGPVTSADRIFVTKFLAPRRWDIVAFRFRSGDIFLKRVVGLPGERIEIHGDGRIFINGVPIGSPPDRPGLTFPWPKEFDMMEEHALTSTTSLHLGPDEYFVVGDNAFQSYDSRVFGPIKKTAVIGVTTFVYWPMNRARIIR